MESTSKYVSFALNRAWLFCIERIRVAMKVLEKIGVSVLIVLFITIGLCYGQSGAKLHLTKGVDYAAQGKFKKAKDEFDKALKADPFFEATKRALKVIEDVNDKKIESEPAIHFFKGVAYVMKGQYDQAIADFNKAIELNPKYAMAYSNRVYAYIYLVKIVRACDDWKKACDLGQCKELKWAKKKGVCR